MKMHFFRRCRRNSASSFLSVKRGDPVLSVGFTTAVDSGAGALKVNGERLWQENTHMAANSLHAPAQENLWYTHFEFVWETDFKQSFENNIYVSLSLPSQQTLLGQRQEQELKILFQRRSLKSIKCLCLKCKQTNRAVSPCVQTG